MRRRFFVDQVRNGHAEIAGDDARHLTRVLRVEAGQRLLVLEAMKMEIAVAAPYSGIVEQLNCTLGELVSAGQYLVAMRLDAR